MKTYQKVLITISIAIPLLLVGALYFIYIWEGSTKNILSVSDQLRIPPSWTLTSEGVTPPRISCWEGSGCPYVHKKWKPNTPVSKQTFEELLKSSSWNFPIEGDCQLPHNAFGEAISVCSATGTVDNFNVNLWLSINSDQPDQQQFTLTVEPAD